MTILKFLWQWVKETPTRHRPGFVEWLPLIAQGVNWLGKEAGWWGGQPKPPDINAQRFQYDNEWIKEWTTKSEAAATEQANRFLNEAMQGINRSAGERGLVGTGYVGGKGQQAAELSAEQLATAFANISGQAAQMEHTGQMQAMDLYNQEYQKYLDQLYADQEAYIASLIGLIPTS